MSSLLDIMMSSQASIMGGSYDNRKIDRTQLENGLLVSTCRTFDMGPETAILDTKGNAHPVERYIDEKSAIEGHKKWVEFAKTGIGKTIKKLGHEDMMVDETQIVLK